MDELISSKKKKALITKNKIYETAIQLIRTKGYSNVTIDEICEKSGVTKGAFYYHFSSKKDLLHSSYISSDSRVFQELPHIMKKENSLEQTKAIFLLYAEMAQSKGVEVMKQIIQNNLNSQYSDEELSLFYIRFFDPNKRPMIEIQIAILKDGQKNDEIRDDLSSAKILQYLITIFNGFILDWCYHGGRYDLKEKINEAWSHFIESEVRKK